jgi:ATP-binding cassette subfamily B (MDR/TAP) protein 1
MVAYGKLVWTFADSSDRFYWITGVIASALCGTGLPSFVFLFGDITDTFEGGMDPAEILKAITRVSMILSIIGGVILLGSYLFYLFMTIASERIGAKTRVAYLRSILSQDIAWFDQINTSELSQRIGKEC